MKLLLTSNGFSNDVIVDSFARLIEKPLHQTSLVFIPTASNIETGDKEWVIDDLINIKKLGLASIAITDISAVEQKIWKPELEAADVLFFEGGNTYHLMHWMHKSGLVELLPKMLETKVYVGLSAGSMVTGPDLDLRLSRVIYGEEVEKDTMAGLGLTSFYVLPHLNNPFFQGRIEANLNPAMKDITRKTYVLDDNSALEVVDGRVTVVGGGEYLEFN